jgi:hypothetical protein
LKGGSVHHRTMKTSRRAGWYACPHVRHRRCVKSGDGPQCRSQRQPDHDAGCQDRPVHACAGATALAMSTGLATRSLWQMLQAVARLQAEALKSVALGRGKVSPRTRAPCTMASATPKIHGQATLRRSAGTDRRRHRGGAAAVPGRAAGQGELIAMRHGGVAKPKSP